MKLNDRMRYPHPVLSEFSSDYVSGDFLAEFSQNLTKQDELRIESRITLNNADLQGLIETQKAAAGYFIICRRTYYSRLETVPTGLAQRFFNARKLFGTIQLRPVVWTLSEISSFKSELFDCEFGPSVSIAKGAVIAMGPEFRFSMDRKKFKPFDSIFQLAQDDSAPPGTFAVDHAQERITISAEGRTFNSIAGMRNLPAGRDMLLGVAYMPAVMEVVTRMQMGDNMEPYRWFRVFRAKCDDLGIDPADQAHSPLKIAQELLRKPFSRIIRVAETI